MIKIFIADDEYMIIEGLKRMVDWDKNGYMVIGESDNGLKAYKKIKELKPDIVLTDLKMPGMTGLDIIKAAKDEKLECKFIIISGYKDFQYCQEALTLGVCDYLLKPIDFSIIIPKVNNIAKNYLKDNQRKDAILKRYFASVFSGIVEPANQSNNDIEDIISSEYIYNICAVYSENDLGNINHNFCNFSFYYHLMLKNKHIFVFGEDHKKDLESKIINFKEYFNLNSNHCKGSFILGFGGICGFNDIYQSYSIAVCSAENKVFYGVDYIDVSRKSLSESKYLKGRIKECFEGLREFENESVEKSLCDFFNFAVLNRIEKTQVIGSIEELYIMIENLYDSNCIDLRFEMKKLNQVVSIYELKTLIMNTLNSLILSLKLLANNDPIEKIKAYINKHYMDELSLNSVSNTFFFNPSYLSRLFKEKTNVTFTDYVNKVRVDKAKPLLLSSDMNIAKISVMLGYSSYRYFTKVFRKFTGLTPQEYKKNPLQINMNQQYIGSGI